MCLDICICMFTNIYIYIILGAKANENLSALREHTHECNQSIHMGGALLNFKLMVTGVYPDVMSKPCVANPKSRIYVPMAPRLNYSPAPLRYI